MKATHRKLLASVLLNALIIYLDMVNNFLLITIFIAVGVLLLCKFRNLYAQSLSDSELDTQYAFPKENLTHYNLNTVNITMSRGMCLGTCPAYYLEIHGNGKVIYRGKFYVKDTGEYNGKISTEKLKDLVKWIDENDYFSLNDRYDHILYTDAPSVYTSVYVDGKYKQIYHYLGIGLTPEVKKLLQFEHMIDNVTNSAQ